VRLSGKLVARVKAFRPSEVRRRLAPLALVTALFAAGACKKEDSLVVVSLTASPADTGPLGQTAAAGNFQQPQYADARWPGAKQGRTATFGNAGGPSASATAASYKATAAVINDFRQQAGAASAAAIDSYKAKK